MLQQSVRRSARPAPHLAAPQMSPRAETVSVTADPPYRRDRVTQLFFGTVAGYAYVLYGLGSMLTLLIGDLRLPYSMIGVHSTVFSAGVVVPGLLLRRLVALVGRRRLLWTSQAALAVGAVLLVMGRGPVVTLPAVALLGTGGVVGQVLALALLSGRHGGRRDRALVEVNAAASAAAVAAPLVIGLFAATAFGWRAGLAVPVVAAFALYGRYGRVRLDLARPVRTARSGGGRAARLPTAFWLGCVVFGLVVGAEFCVVYFAGSLLQRSAHVGAGTAASLTTVFTVGELLGRLAGTRLTARPGRTRMLLLAMIGLSTVAVLGFWLAGTAAAMVGTLFLLGLGMANLSPLALALAVAPVPHRADDATARTQLVAGLGIMLAPLALGVLADRIGLQAAFGVDPVLLGLAALLLWRGVRRSGAHAFGPDDSGGTGPLPGTAERAVRPGAADSGVPPPTGRHRRDRSR